ncbi:MAG: hypothetical protein AAGU14_06995 [Eubacteriaceae bacterium]
MNNANYLPSINALKDIADDIRHIDASLIQEIAPKLVIGNCNVEIIPLILYKNTRGYLEKLVDQINRTYLYSCFDACALLIRKLIEILIIEIYENSGRILEITFSGNSQLFGLEQLISKVENDPHWKLNRSVITGLEKIKSQGDKAAHYRRYNSSQADLDAIKPYLRDISEELLYISKINK